MRHVGCLGIFGKSQEVGHSDTVEDVRGVLRLSSTADAVASDSLDSGTEVSSALGASQLFAL